jgi:hypothetical protein
VAAGVHEGLAYQSGKFLITVGIGLAVGVIGVALLWLLLSRLRLGEVLGTSAQLACVVGVAAACDIAREDAGCWPPSSWGWRWRTGMASTSRPGGPSSRRWCS